MRFLAIVEFDSDTNLDDVQTDLIPIFKEIDPLNVDIFNISDEPPDGVRTILIQGDQIIVGTAEVQIFREEDLN